MLADFSKGHRMTKLEKQQRAAVTTDSDLESGRIELGKHYAIVTVSPIYHGVLEAMTSEHYTLIDAAWVVETGRLSEFILDPAKVATEAEFVGRVHVERGSVMSIYPTGPGKVTTR
jgi:hypothetical protein